MTKVENPDLKKVHKVLKMLAERPEEVEEQFFMQDIYTCPQLKQDPSKYT